MNLQQPVQPRPSANGFTHRRAERDMGARIKNKSQPGKFNPSRVTGLMSSSGGGSYESPSQDRLVYLSNCLIGLQVEVQVKNGSIFSGIFHASNTDKDFGIVLKMARLIKDASNRGQRAAPGAFNKAPSNTQIITAHELVQIIAKDVPLSKEGISIELQHEKRDLLLDAYISKSRHVEGERQLERWVPDKDDPHCAELENVFDSRWTGSWDQFKVNETLFGVKSTFSEELYTTKLENGPQMKELEEEAMRIAREIEGQDTHDLHLAEERGIYNHGNFDIDEETRYSSVFRGVDDSGYADEDTMIDTHNYDTFGDSSRLATATGRAFADVTSGKTYGGDQVLSSTDGVMSPQLNVNRELPHSGSLADDYSSRRCDAMEQDFRIQENHINEEGRHADANDCVRTLLDEGPQTTTTEDLRSSLNSKEDNSVEGIPSAETTTSTVSDSLMKLREDTSSSSSELKKDAGCGKVHGTLLSKRSCGRPSSSASSTSEGGGSISLSGPPLSASSSMGSLSSEKSTLNPNAKEFKLNPNAKSFVPSQTPVRPLSPVAADNSFYYPANMPAVLPMHGMHVGLGVGPSFPGPHPVMFNPQAGPMQPAPLYFPPNGPQYGQQMFVHPRQVMYMPSYPTEMPYKGREFRNQPG